MSDIKIVCQNKKARHDFFIEETMEAGIADHVWEVEELVGLLEARENAVIGTDANKRGPYGPRNSD